MKGKTICPICGQTVMTETRSGIEQAMKHECKRIQDLVKSATWKSIKG